MNLGTSHYRAFFKAAILVGFPVIISRMLGLIREQYSLYLFGATWELDAYISAYKIPTLLRNLLGEGAFSVVFISIFSGLWTRNKLAAQKFTNQVLSYLILISGIICIIAFFSAPHYMHLIHRSSENFLLTVHLSRIMLFFINFISIAGILMGVLNSQHRYIVPAMAPAIANIVNIFIIHFGHQYFGINILAVGYLMNAFVIMAIQIPFVYKLGVGFSFDFSYGPRLAFFLRSFFPVAFGMAFFQINQLLTNSFSSQVEGGNSIIDKSFLVIQMAIAVLSAGISTALLPTISREKNQLLRNQIYRESMKTTFIVVFPSVILFMLFGKEISSFVYKDLILLFIGNLGKIQEDTIIAIGHMLTLFAPAILIYSLLTMVTRSFQGMNFYIYPLIGSAISTIINLVLMYTIFPLLGLNILPISLLIASSVDLVLLVFLLKYKCHQNIFLKQDILFLIKNILAAFITIFCIFYLKPILEHMDNLISLPILFLIGFGIYFLILLGFREEITIRIYRAVFMRAR